MDVAELKEDLIERCKLIRTPIENKIREHEEWLNCTDKKIREMASNDDLQREVAGVKKWLRSIDNRMWAFLVGIALSFLSSTITLIVVLIKFNKSGG